MVTPDTRVIRVFLSSTFVDFQEERSLLVKQVFPSLRRRAKSRGVEIVDVDLRWGVTAEQTERGETLPLCLAEIDNCRPYFISLLGERYGWVPPRNFYMPALLERLPWLKKRRGGASVTELEILHAVLRNPEKAGHALFYLRDTAYAQAQQEEGWVAQNSQEKQRLESLKEQIRASGFPVAEGLANPQAIAQRIEADLWAVIERKYPQQEPPDALQRQEQRHSDYRRSRTGLYLGGEAAIEQLEGWIADGEQRILITGDSGAGKSALFANWMQRHAERHPEDVVYAHHLGCTNDASAVRPLLWRLIDAASQLLLAEQKPREPITVPQDWWELVFKVADVFAMLSSWCERKGCRWILVLDGLDRLADDDQQALPWIPTTLPPGIHVVASALDCQARTILQERQYRTHEIGPLGGAEQQQLIERYLSRYTKQLESGLQQKILEHKLAGSPLFLRVLLEELRQCAWFDTLAEQLDFYLSAQTIDGLYAKVLERLENDGHGEATRKALTALWASRAGLSETELLDITGLPPLEWAPVDLALSEAFGRNGQRLVFDHDYLRHAVRGRYFQTKEHRQQAHTNLAHWFGSRDGWDERDSEELLFQLQQAGQEDQLRDWLLEPALLVNIVEDRGSSEVLDFLNLAFAHESDELDTLLSEPIRLELERLADNPPEAIRVADKLSELLEQVGLCRDLHLSLRKFSYDTDVALSSAGEESLGFHKFRYADALHLGGYCDNALELMRECVSDEKAKRPVSFKLYLRMCDLASMLADLDTPGSDEESIAYYEDSLPRLISILGEDHPDCSQLNSDYATLLIQVGRNREASDILRRSLESMNSCFGDSSIESALVKWNLATSLWELGDREEALMLAEISIATFEVLLGSDHVNTCIKKIDLGFMLVKSGRKELGRKMARFSLDRLIKVFGKRHPKTIHGYQIMAEIEFLTGHLISSLTMLPKAFRNVLN